MHDFQLVTPGGEPVVFKNEALAAFKKYVLTGGNSWMAGGNYGHIIMNRFAGEGFTIYCGHYLIEQNISFTCIAGYPGIYLFIPWMNCFQWKVNGMNLQGLSEKQWQLFYIPGAPATSVFSRGNHYQAFSIRFEKSILVPFANHCQPLFLFLQHIERETAMPFRLLNSTQFLTPEMVRIVKAIVDFKSMRGLAQQYYNALVHQLLTLLAVQVTATIDSPAFSTDEQQKAQEVCKIIIRDFEEYHEVTELARMVGLAELQLEAVFKHVYHTTVAAYSKQARLMHAHGLLEKHNYPLRVVCGMAGYADPSNFSKAFLKQFGYRPGEIQKRK